jgi:glycosyltransferase involved in cell wall biosynthesis
MEKDKVSVIIPTYNSEDYINEAIKSVLSQTYKNYEIIIVDDGSSDNTATLLKKYQGRLKYFYQNNQGSAAARNLGLNNSSGEFIAFLDSDDVWFPEKLEKQVRIMKENPRLAFVFAAAYMVNESGEIVKCWDNKNEPTMDFKRLYEKNFICTSTVLLRRYCLERIGNFDENLKMSQDWDLWLRLAKKFEFKFICQPLINYRMHSNNITRRYDERIKYVLSIVNKPDIAENFSLLKGALGQLRFTVNGPIIVTITEI